MERPDLTRPSATGLSVDTLDAHRPLVALLAHCRLRNTSTLETPEAFRLCEGFRIVSPLLSGHIRLARSEGFEPPTF